MNLFLPTCTCQVSGSSSVVTRTEWSPAEPEDGVIIHEILSNFIKASSCQCVTCLSLKSRHFAAFLHLCSKFVIISYAAGPSTLQCKSCHGCLGPRARDCTYYREHNCQNNVFGIQFPLICILKTFFIREKKIIYKYKNSIQKE